MLITDASPLAPEVSGSLTLGEKCLRFRDLARQMSAMLRVLQTRRESPCQVIALQKHCSSSPGLSRCLGC